MMSFVTITIDRLIRGVVRTSPQDPKTKEWNEFASTQEGLSTQAMAVVSTWRVKEEDLGRLNGHLQLVLLLGWSFGFVVGVAVWLVMLMVQCIGAVSVMKLLTTWNFSLCVCFLDMRLMHLLQDPTVGLANGMFLHKNTSRLTMSLLYSYVGQWYVSPQKHLRVTMSLL